MHRHTVKSDNVRLHTCEIDFGHLLKSPRLGEPQFLPSRSDEWIVVVVVIRQVSPLCEMRDLRDLGASRGRRASRRTARTHDYA